MQVVDAVQATAPQIRLRSLVGHVTARLPQWSRNGWVWVGVVAAAWFLLMSSRGLGINLDRDEGAFLTIAQGILHGRLPYRDMFDQKGPAIYYVLAVILVVTQGLSPLHQVLVARIVVVFVNLLTAGGLIVLGRRYWRLEVGVLAALLWLFGLGAYGGDQLFTEPFAVACTVGSLLLASRGASLRRAVSAGVLFALASMFKQTAILALPGVAVLLLADPATHGLWRLLRRLSRADVLRVAVFIGGLAAAWLVVTAYFAARGALGPYFDQVVMANIRYPADPLSDIRTRIAAAIAENRVVWYAAALLVAYGIMRWLGLFRSRRGPTAGELAVALVGALSLIPFSSHAYIHYWLQILPFAALLAAALITGLVGWYATSCTNAGAVGDAPDGMGSDESLPAPGSAGRALILPVLIIGIIVLSTGQSLKPRSPLTPSPLLQQQAGAGAWIDTYAPPGAHLLVAPAQPEFYFLSQRLPDTTYVYVLPVNATDAFIAQFTDDLRQARFDVVVWADVPDLANQMSCTVGLMAPCGALAQHYHPVAANAALGLTVYVPNQPSA